MENRRNWIFLASVLFAVIFASSIFYPPSRKSPSSKPIAEPTAHHGMIIIRDDGVWKNGDLSDYTNIVIEPDSTVRTLQIVLYDTNDWDSVKLARYHSIIQQLTVTDVLILAGDIPAEYIPRPIKLRELHIRQFYGGAFNDAEMLAGFDVVRLTVQYSIATNVKFSKACSVEVLELICRNEQDQVPDYTDILKLSQNEARLRQFR